MYPGCLQDPNTTPSIDILSSNWPIIFTFVDDVNNDDGFGIKIILIKKEKDGGLWLINWPIIW